MPYEPFPIYDFKSGLRLNKEPFMLPFDAFDVFKDVYIDKGSIVKRKGINLFGHLNHQYLNEDSGVAGDGSKKEFTINLNNTPIYNDSVTIRATTTDDNTETFEDDSNGNLTSDKGGSGTINYETGEVNLSFANPVKNGEHIYSDYRQLINRPITGFKTLRTVANNIYNFVFDTKGAYYVDNITGVVQHLEDFLNGDKDSYVQCEDWRYKIFATNNSDRPFWFDNTNWGFLDVDFDNDGNNDIDRCSLILEFKERLLLFSTTEKGTAYPQRIRWCKPNNPFDWTNDEYLDIPTSEIIISAQKLNDKIIVWCSNSVWTLYYTADPDMPFIVKCVAREIKTFGRMSAVVAEDKIFNISDTGIIITDGVNFERIDIAIPNFFENTNRAKKRIIYGYHYKPLNQIWWAYCSINSDEKDKVLYFDYLNKIWGIYSIKINVFSEIITKRNAPTWDEITKSWDEISWAWDNSTFQDELLLTLFGGYTGEIGIGLIDYKDGEDNIEIDLNSVNLNPYLLQGGVKKASLGWIDFYVDCADTSLTIEFYGDNKLSPILIQDINLSGTTDKKWVRVKYGGRFEIHRIKIKQSDSVDLKIHAIIPYFKPLGRYRRK